MRNKRLVHAAVGIAAYGDYTIHLVFSDGHEEALTLSRHETIMSVAKRIRAFGTKLTEEAMKEVTE